MSGGVALLPSSSMPDGGLDLGAIDLNLVHALDVLLRERNVTRAAAQLGLTQSAMSHRLKRLRELLEDPLLVPGRGGLVATARAQQLGHGLRCALEDLRGALSRREHFDPATSERTFVVVTTDFAEFEILPRVLQVTTREAPRICTVMREPWPGMVAALERGEVDLVIGPSLSPQPGLVQRRVGEDDFASCVRVDHPRLRRRLDLETYVELRHLVITPTGGDGISPVDEALAARSLRRKVAMRVPHFVGAPFIVARSDLLLTAPRSLLVHAAELLPLRLFDPPLPLPTVRTVMTWHERVGDDPGHAYLRELAATCTRDAIAHRRGRRGRQESPARARSASKPGAKRA